MMRFRYESNTTICCICAPIWKPHIRILTAEKETICRCAWAKPWQARRRLTKGLLFFVFDHANI